MPETKKYCTPLPKEVIKISELNPENLSDNIFEAELKHVDESVVDLSEGPTTQDLDGPEFEDGPEVPGWEDRSKNTEFGITDKSTPQPTCETNPKSIGCRVLGDQFIYAIQGLITDLESIKPSGYILAVGKLKGAIIKLQAGD